MGSEALFLLIYSQRIQGSCKADLQLVLNTLKTFSILDKSSNLSTLITHHIQIVPLIQAHN